MSTRNARPPDDSERILIDFASEPAGVPRAKAMLARAEWAARAFAAYDKDSVDRILAAVARVAAERAGEYAEWAVRETGFGVVEHKRLKNVASSTDLVERYRDHDYVTPRSDPVAKILSVPKPAGVVLALVPSTNPISTIYFKTLICLMTRNAVVVSPHPMAEEVSTAATRALAEAAVEAGAPDGVIQVVDHPSIPLIDALITDERTNMIVATGGTAVVRAAYSSGNPAFGVGPGNVPVLVDATADLKQAARRIIESKSFDNSILCTNESVLIIEEKVADNLLRHMEREGAHLLTEEERDLVRERLFPGGQLDTGLIGKSASEIATASGVRTAPNARVLLAPLAAIVPEEPLAHEKLCPVLGVVRVPTPDRGIRTAQALLRIGGTGHSAAVHTNDHRVVMAYAAAMPVLRVAVNVGASLGSAGYETHLSPTMTIGTGYFGRSSLVENLHPKHLVQWTEVAYNADPSEAFGNFGGMQPWERVSGHVPAYPQASNLASPDRGRSFARVVSLTDSPGVFSKPGPPATLDTRDDLREEIRRLVLEELASLTGAR